MSHKIRLCQNSHCLKSKVKSILSNRGVRLDERYLVALTLINDGDLMIDDDSQAREIFFYCIRLIRTQDLHFIRIACKWLSEANRYHYQWTHVVKEVLNAIKNRIRAPIVPVDDDLLYVIALSTQKDKSITLTSNDFDMIWNRISLGSRLSEREEVHNVADSDILLMNSVIEIAIGKENESTWMMAWWEIWQFSAPNIAIYSNCLPQWYQSMLLFAVGFHTGAKSCIRWHDMALNFSATSIAHFSNFDSMSAEAMKALTDIITVHIAHPQSDLLPKAWNICCLLISHHGWDCIMQQSDSCLTNSNSSLCIWTRLASGEYRIQLSLASDSAESFNQEILTSVSHIIIQSFQKVIYEASRLDDGQSTTLGSNAVLHLKTSLIDALEATISYFEKVESPLTISCKVLGCMLVEMSIWDDTQLGINTERILNAVSRCISCRVVEILPSLSNVLDIDISDHEKMQTLIQSGILGVDLVAYFAEFWVENAFENNPYTTWACSAIEKWCSIAGPLSGASKRISEKIILWLKEFLKKESKKQICSQTILSVVDCYAVLTRDGHPLEQEVALISLVLSQCNHDSDERGVFRNKSNPVPAKGRTKLSI